MVDAVEGCRNGAHSLVLSMTGRQSLSNELTEKALKNEGEKEAVFLLLEARYL